MLDAMLDKTGEHLSQTARLVSRATAAVGEAVEDGIGSAKRSVKRGCDAAEEFIEENQQRIQRHPIEFVAASFAIGVGVGVLIGWLGGRR